MNIDHEPIETTVLNARRVRGSKLTRVGIAIEFPDGFTAIGDADFPTGLGTLQMQNSILRFGFSEVESEMRPLCTFHIDHRFFRSPSVAINSLDDDTTLVLKQRWIWSYTIDAFLGNKRVGTFVSNLPQTKCTAVLDTEVPIHLGIVAIWCIMIRCAFAV